jgi:triosephosphate isomerase (TIM)
MKLHTPTLMINTKTYAEASGKDAVLLAKICKEIASKTKKNISLCVQAVDIAPTSKQHKHILAQHIDIQTPGGHTGKIHLKALKENGCIGSIINHSENKISFKHIAESIALLQEAGMIAVVCVKTPCQARRVARLSPDAIAIEPPKLIGGDVSVTTANPKIISQSVNAVHKINPNIAVLCGAGVKNTNDVKKAIELGAKGVLVASGVVQAKNQKKAIEDLVKGL